MLGTNGLDRCELHVMPGLTESGHSWVAFFMKPPWREAEIRWLDAVAGEVRPLCRTRRRSRWSGRQNVCDSTLSQATILAGGIAPFGAHNQAGKFPAAVS